MGVKNSAPTDAKKCKACLTDIPQAASKCFKCGASQGMHPCLIILIVLVVLFFAIPFLFGFFSALFHANQLANDAKSDSQVETQASGDAIQPR